MKTFVLVCLVAAAAASLQQKRFLEFIDDLGDMYRCQREFTEGECRQCCHDLHLAIPAEETGCDAVCDALHPSKRQLGDFAEIRHCREEPTEVACVRCCDQADLSLEDRGCINVCDRTFTDRARRQFFEDLAEIRECQRRDTALACDACCRAEHFTLPLEERGCERLCNRTHDMKRRQFLGELQEIIRCQQRVTAEACHQCCHAEHFTLPLEERGCDGLCDRTHDRQRRQLLGDHAPITQCQVLANEEDCDGCCRAAYYTMPTVEEDCEELCGTTHRARRQSGDDDFLTPILCLQHSMPDECKRCCRHGDPSSGGAEDNCEQMCDSYLPFHGYLG